MRDKQSLPLIWLLSDARNDAHLDRLVLIFDIWHPDLEPIERAQIRELFRAVDTY